MSSGSPTRSGLLQNLSRISVNTPGTPLWHTASPLAPWQQILSIPSMTQHATHTPSNFTPLNSSTSGIFQYNSVPPAPKIRTWKRLNNENPDTPTPKRAQKTAAGTAPRPNPLSTITASAINENSGDNLNDSLGNNSKTLTTSCPSSAWVLYLFKLFSRHASWSLCLWLKSYICPRSRWDWPLEKNVLYFSFFSLYKMNKMSKRAINPRQKYHLRRYDARNY